ncbi:MAG: prepilin-type N-terminal cleavage/methylation domain-containing protein [Candidatus Paracaedibacteraceae bacterium]|nr:prepilin-type N-terminal cleavage/methylation domain-containing protein [Candidatus Paracaedibacteraceae bacterium]
MLRHRVKAFSLIELSIVLVIVGVLMGAIFKGQDLLDVAKVRSVVHDFHRIQVAFHAYHDSYGMLPGDDSRATNRFGNAVTNGNGNGLIEPNEQDNVWIHLHKAGDFDSDTAPTSKLGGNYDVVSVPNATMTGNWIRLSKDHGYALLSPKQAQRLMSKVDEGQSANDASKGQIRVTEGQGIASGQCVSTIGALNLDVKAPTCIVYMQLS